MPNHNVIIGGGPAATNAIETIRQFDGGDSKITLISDEPAHSRMALPYWLSGQVVREHTHTGDDGYFGNLGVETRIGEHVEKIDAKGKKLTLSGGSSLEFDQLLIATGSAPIGLPIPGADLDGVQPLWSLAHTQSALDAVDGVAKPRVVMIGSGFIGFIMLNAMHKRGWQLAVVEREAHVLPRMLNAQAADIAQKWLGRQGVDLHCGTTVSGITASGKAKTVELADGTKLEADLVIVATGVQPNVGFVASSGVDVEEGVPGGIPVNDRMQTNVSYIFAAGDVAKGPVLGSDEKAVHAIQPTAVDHGRIAGANMAGQSITYPGSLSMNILDVCGLQCASFGDWTDTGDTMTIANAEGFIYRSLIWTGDHITGAVFAGRPTDMGMLTDVGMVKGILQTNTAMGPWKQFLAENPFDIRRPYVATKVAQKLAGSTLLGRPAATRQFQFKGAGAASPAVGKSHDLYVSTKQG
ncbi:MAG: hypothetical protein CMJ18_07080 [Phycisphaeraceae bacterium]|nr:hypothetical protein [Phycisphaeraceae bacterium]